MNSGNVLCDTLLLGTYTGVFIKLSTIDYFTGIVITMSKVVNLNYMTAMKQHPLCHLDIQQVLHTEMMTSPQ